MTIVADDSSPFGPPRTTGLPVVPEAPASIPTRSPEELTQAAWAALNEVTYSGQITLPGGVVLVPEAKTVIDVLKWLAQLQGKPKKTPKAMDDWVPRETKQ